MRQSGVDTLITEEPDDRIGHVRICGDNVHNTHHVYVIENQETVVLSRWSTDRCSDSMRLHVVPVPTSGSLFE